MDFWKEVPMLPVAKDKEELYERLEKIMDLNEEGTIDYLAMVDMLHRELEKFKKSEKK
jgi:hypothetical protein